jgi:hypothetical protein
MCATSNNALLSGAPIALLALFSGVIQWTIDNSFAVLGTCWWHWDA